MLEIEKSQGIATLVMNRPAAMNALSKSLRNELYHQFVALGCDPEIRVIILTGTGERAFCAGLDLKEVGMDAEALRPADGKGGGVHNPVKAIEACAKPVIAAINGVAITGGLELALACDILIASENARFADTHVRIGVMPGWGLSQKLSRTIGISRAKEMSLTGNFIDARTATDWGLVNCVVPATDLEGSARRLAQDIAGASPASVEEYKALIDRGYGLSFADALDHEDAVARAHNGALSPDVIEAQRQAVISRGREQAG